VEGESNDVARALFNLVNVTPRKIIIRSLAWMYCQAIICSKSIGDDLRNRIVNCDLFTDADAFGPNSHITNLMNADGFSRDWERIREQAFNSAATNVAALSNAQSAHEELVKIFNESDLDGTVRAIVEDIVTWLNTDDEEVPFWKLVIYPIHRASEIYDQLKV